MRRYLLHDLVRVRRHREEQAGEAVARAVRAFKESQTALEAAQQELAQYTVWRVQEERRRLDALMRRTLRLGELSDVRQEIALLREREFEFVDRVKQAEAATAKAEAHLEECRLRHAQTVRELEKLLEHRALWQREEAANTERDEDAALEDFGRPVSAAHSFPETYARN